MLRALGISLSALLMVAGCASTPGSNAQKSLASLQAPSVQFLFVPARRANMEPCGCTVRPVGGVVREANALKELRAHEGVVKSFYLVSGPSLVGEEKPTRALGEQKAQLMIQAMNELQVNAYSPAADDFVLGNDTIQKMANASKFPWVSSNLVWKGKGKSVFQPSLELTLPDGRKAVVMGVSRPSLKWLKNSNVTQVDPFKAIEKLLAGPAGKADLKIIVSSLPEADNAELVDKFPGVHLVLGGDGVDPMLATSQESPTQLRVSPDSRGRTIAFFELATPWPTDGIKQFYSKEMASHWEKMSSGWQNSEFRLEDNLNRLPKHAEAKDWKKQLARLKRLLATAKELEKPAPAAVKFTSGIVDLDARYDGANTLSPLVANFQKIAPQNH